MKNIILSILILCIVQLSYSQIIGIDFSTAIVPKNDYDITYEQLHKLSNGYTIPYELTPVGVKHCIVKFTELMSANNLTMENIEREDILLASYVDDIYDYSNLCLSLRVSESEVTYVWEKNDWLICLILSNKICSIMFAKI